MTNSERGYDWLVDVWGGSSWLHTEDARAAIEAMGRNSDKFDVALIQLVNLLRDNNQVSMSTRAGTFVTPLKMLSTRSVLMPPDSCFYRAKATAPLDFDLELAKKNARWKILYIMFNMHMPGFRRSCAGQRSAASNLADFSSPEILARRIRQKTRHCRARLRFMRRDAGKCGPGSRPSLCEQLFA